MWTIASRKRAAVQSAGHGVSHGILRLASLCYVDVNGVRILVADRVGMSKARGAR